MHSTYVTISSFCICSITNRNLINRKVVASHASETLLWVQSWKIMKMQITLHQDKKKSEYFSTIGRCNSELFRSRFQLASMHFHISGKGSSLPPTHTTPRKLSGWRKKKNSGEWMLYWQPFLGFEFYIDFLDQHPRTPKKSNGNIK